MVTSARFFWEIGTVLEGPPLAVESGVEGGAGHAGRRKERPCSPWWGSPAAPASLGRSRTPPSHNQPGTVVRQRAHVHSQGAGAAQGHPTGLWQGFGGPQDKYYPLSGTHDTPLASRKLQHGRNLTLSKVSKCLLGSKHGGSPHMCLTAQGEGVHMQP